MELNDEEETLDPRIQEEINQMNAAMEENNKLQNSLNAERASFEDHWNRYKKQQDTMIASQKMARAVEQSKPYYIASLRARELQLEAQRAAQRFEHAVALLDAAKEMSLIAETDTLANHKDGKQVGTAWQEVLAAAVCKVNEAERAKKQADIENIAITQRCTEIQNELNHLKKENASHIRRAKPYFDAMEQNSRDLNERRERIERVERQLCESKRKYAAALSALEGISREIHERRGDLDAAILQAQQQDAAEREAEVAAIGSISGAISNSAAASSEPPQTSTDSSAQIPTDSSSSTVTRAKHELPNSAQQNESPAPTDSENAPDRHVHFSRQERKFSQPAVASPVAPYASATLPESAARAVAAHRMSIQQQAMLQPLSLDASQMLGALPALDLLRQNVNEYPSEYVSVRRRLGFEKHYYRHFFSRPNSMPAGASDKADQKKKPRATADSTDAAKSASRPKSSCAPGSTSGLLVTSSHKTASSASASIPVAVAVAPKSSSASNTSANGAALFARPVRLADQPSELYRMLEARELETDSLAEGHSLDATNENSRNSAPTAARAVEEDESRERSETLTSTASLAGSSSEATASSTSMSSNSNSERSASAETASCSDYTVTSNDQQLRATPTHESTQPSTSSSTEASSPARSAQGSVLLREKTGGREQSVRESAGNSGDGGAEERASLDSSSCASERSSAAGDTTVSPTASTLKPIESLVRRSELMGEEIDKLKSRLSMLQIQTESGGGGATAAASSHNLEFLPDENSTNL